MFLLGWEFHAMLKLSVVDKEVEPSPAGWVELAERRQALNHLDDSIVRMYWRGRVVMTTVGLKRKKVWLIDGVEVQGGQLYVDRGRPYTETPSGRIRPLEWSDLNTDDVKFAAFTLGI